MSELDKDPTQWTPEEKARRRKAALIAIGILGFIAALLRPLLGHSW